VPYRACSGSNVLPHDRAPKQGRGCPIVLHAHFVLCAGVETGKWFVDEKALAGHKKGRFYKMRVKELKGAAPHSQRDADMAVGLGVDNGPKLGRDPRPKAMEME